MILGLVAGCFLGRLACGSLFFRNQLGLLLGRGPLRALVSGSGLYQGDILRAAEQARYRKGGNDRGPLSAEEESAVLRALIANRVVLSQSEGQPIRPAAIQREFAAIHGQILPEQSWRMALQRNKLSAPVLEAAVAGNLRALAWLEGQIAGRVQVGEDECLRYYQAHCNHFCQPPRLRVSHLFLAAPPGTPGDITEQKRSRIETVWKRIQQGEDFAQLAFFFSEDERTKSRGGDLGFFGEWRMPADFFAAVKDIPVGSPQGIIRSYLGFHIVLITDTRGPFTMTFEQARPEIRREIANQKRAVAVQEMAALLSGEAEYVRPPAR